MASCMLNDWVLNKNKLVHTVHKPFIKVYVLNIAKKAKAKWLEVNIHVNLIEMFLEFRLASIAMKVLFESAGNYAQRLKESQID